ncbi:hypothetical protein J1N35_004761 [Gossypium stocksii]|uniref:Uncharacterized protein n=1 Tax=Gossypium stocksii TaxID=47602 RepID=A0A9D3WCK2_9ROSI|nr:hypothetical protein J1N35_004761 [Gossypium stocksii]
MDGRRRPRGSNGGVNAMLEDPGRRAGGEALLWGTEHKGSGCGTCTFHHLVLQLRDLLLKYFSSNNNREGEGEGRQGRDGGGREEEIQPN